MNEIDWDAVNAHNWQACKDGKQAEFLLEQQFPWHLIEEIGVINQDMNTQVQQILNAYHVYKPNNYHPTGLVLLRS